MKFHKFEETFTAVCQENKNSAGEMAQKRMALTNHLIPYFGDMALDSIGPKDVRRYKDEKLADGFSPKTINNHLNVLSRYLVVAREEQILKNEKWIVKLITLDAVEARFLDSKEIIRLVASAQVEDNNEWLAMIRLGINTGLRVGELLGLDWSDINMHKRILTVNKSRCRVSGKLKKPKNGMKRDVALNTSAIDALKLLTHRSGPVFSMSYQGAYSAMKRISERAELDHVGWHTLRHTFASHLVTSNKVALIAVSKLLGHRSLRMTERYAHLSQDKNKDAVAALEDIGA